MRAWLWPVLILGWAGLVVFSVDMNWAARPLITFGFVIFCPGMAVVRFMRLTEWLTELGLAVTVSLAFTMLGLEVMLYLQLWSSLTALWVLVALSGLGATLQLVVVLRQKG